MTVHLYDNFTGSWSSVSTGVDYQIGNPFKLAENATFSQLGFYRPDTGSGVRPDGLALFDRAGGALLAHVVTPTDTGSVGWQFSDLDTPVLGTNGSEYVVVAHYPAGNVWARVSGTSKPVPPTNTAWLSIPRQDESGLGETAYPSSPETGSFFNAVDVTLSDPTPSAGGPPTGVGDLAAWLSNDAAVNTHQSDGTPWETNALGTGASGFAAIKGVVDTIATSVGSGLGTAVSALTTAVGTANTALVHAATTWSDALATALQNMSDDFASFGASKPAQGGGDFGTGTFPSNVGTLVWTLLDETDFVGSIAWAQPADVYVLSITTLPIGLPLNLTDGVHTIYRCGWWTPLNGSFARQRSYIDFEDNHLAIGAERMPGVLVSLQPGGEGHIQAWALT
jgi:hypothetical protein